MNIDLLMNGQAEAVSLSEQGMTITEYLYSFTSSEDAPATMMVNTANGELIRESLSDLPSELSQNDGSFTTGGQMRITINDMLTANDVLLFRAKPATQGVGIGEALQQLIDENNILPTSHIDDYSIPREIYPEGEPTVTRIDGDEMIRILGEIKS